MLFLKRSTEIFHYKKDLILAIFWEACFLIHLQNPVLEGKYTGGINCRITSIIKIISVMADMLLLHSKYCYNFKAIS